jgi:hypothetical protein
MHSPRQHGVAQPPHTHTASSSHNAPSSVSPSQSSSTPLHVSPGSGPQPPQRLRVVASSQRTRSTPSHTVRPHSPHTSPGAASSTAQPPQPLRPGSSQRVASTPSHTR